jgi:hypothetical protein
MAGGVAAAYAADAPALVQQLGSEKESERTQAIGALRRMGEAARDALTKVETSEALAPQHLLLVRKLLGELLIAKSTLQPVATAKLTPFAEDKEKGIVGNPNLLVDKDKKYIMMNGEFALEQGPLEYLVVTKGPNARLHETIVAVYAQPRDICWALMACAYTFAGELGEDGRVNLPKDAGVMVSVEFLWETPHANMDTGIDVTQVLAALQQKAGLLEKAQGQERANLLFDMENDAGLLRRMLDYDVRDEKTGVVTEHSPFRDYPADRCVQDGPQRTALLELLAGFSKRHPRAGTAVATAKAAPRPLPDTKLVRVPIEFFAWNTQTGKPMKRAPFAFTGSKFEKDPNTKKMIFRADEEKSIVAIKLDPFAILNTPLDMRSVDPQHDAGYGVNRHATPRRGTKCRVVFEPWTGEAPPDDSFKDTGDRAAGPAPAPAAR